MTATLPILYIEDNPVNAKILAQYFQKKKKREITIATNGVNALETISREKYEIIFLDLHLPDSSGFDLVEKIRKTGENQLTPIIAVSADKFPDAQLRKAGFNFILEKPIHFPLLDEILNDLSM